MSSVASSATTMTLCIYDKFYDHFIQISLLFEDHDPSDILIYNLFFPFTYPRKPSVSTRWFGLHPFVCRGLCIIYYVKARCADATTNHSFTPLPVNAGFRFCLEIIVAALCGSTARQYWATPIAYSIITIIT